MENFVNLSEQELKEMTGGAVLETAAVIYVTKWVAGGAIALFGAGVFVGYTEGKKK
ncbi:class IIb bacteriocin, lactobin A/cerein 7B family [Streptococcus equi subsp. zooepidemicus]|uniref:class IIb bacteriocin, lactobin A/cerein 7B family n=1 Tax=Streptococcus equi TaxID=1336 RepID=UPI000217574F|nr:class IIb bacteriocin, lactobin A/cerein 7B family [Streptococcus equi]AEJ24742.1 conserved hypothetical protein [Streptococcus equi subsp. zooepidemicus ATCC 35246]AIA68836.1 competence protein [Streptococcus equi subsp. zooepidemicus CY]MBR7684271.1 class IIb bacteriocin, lactobin A/cerein 7B family [Streptococcus equi subsp. zooepidemicus]MBR7753709.1 class IIb bacteriocin, lactobin A/cerein 7B family [Streptococcus equi subsp. zooepidemicus]MBR7776739.1 class IIb bacteriocin, lactobin A